MAFDIDVQPLDEVRVVERKVEYNPSNPHPLSQVRGEFVWDGKYDEWGNRRDVADDIEAIPLQVVETVNEPRSRSLAQGMLFDEALAHSDGFRNRLIWGDNRLAAASLLKEFRGSVSMVYIDPPFDLGADFTLSAPIGDEGDAVEKQQSALEMVAYRDMWGRGVHSYLGMMAQRITLMRELLTDDGVMFLHCDPTASHYLKLLMDEVFGAEMFHNEIIWRRTTAKSHMSRRLPSSHDVILMYSKSEKMKWNSDAVYLPYDVDDLEPQTAAKYSHVDPDGRKYRLDNLVNPNPNRPNLKYEFLGVTRTWRWTRERMAAAYESGIVIQTGPGRVPQMKRYLDEQKGRALLDVWTDIPPLNSQARERLGYPTQKPEALIERLMSLVTDPGDLVADFFCGAGALGAVAERNDRRWLMCDLGRFAVHTTRKRMIEVQRDLNAGGKTYRPFDVLNLGRYERQWWQQERLEGANEDHQRVVLEFYRAERVENSPSPFIHGRKGGALCHVDDIDGIFTREELANVAAAAVSMGARELVCLAWEFEMGLSNEKNAIEAEHGLKVVLIQIPREIMEKNRTSPPPFLEVAKLAAEPVVRSAGGKTVVDIKLTEFVPSLAEVPSKELEALQERAISSGFDFIDFWAVDFDFQHGQPFHHDWQDYRTRGDRTLKTVSDQEYEYGAAGTFTACVKVIDIFGADTSITVEVNA